MRLKKSTRESVSAEYQRNRERCSAKVPLQKVLLRRARGSVKEWPESAISTLLHNASKTDKREQCVHFCTPFPHIRRNKERKKRKIERKKEKSVPAVHSIHSFIHSFIQVIHCISFLCCGVVRVLCSGFAFLVL